MSEGQIYIYSWKNNARRQQLYGRKCRVLKRLAMNSCVVQFIDNGEKAIVSRFAIKKGGEK